MPQLAQTTGRSPQISRKLGALPGQIHRFDAEVDGDFPDHTFPTAATLMLKTGAQVMFVRNDLSPEKRYFNLAYQRQ